MPVAWEREILQAVADERWVEVERLSKRAIEATENVFYIWGLGFSYLWYPMGEFPTLCHRVDEALRYIHEAAICGQPLALQLLIVLYSADEGIVWKDLELVRCLEREVVTYRRSPTVCGLRMYEPLPFAERPKSTIIPELNECDSRARPTPYAAIPERWTTRALGEGDRRPGENPTLIRRPTGPRRRLAHAVSRGAIAMNLPASLPATAEAEDGGYWRVPRLWPGATVVCLGGGPSLEPADVAYAHGRARVIAINDAWRLAPWADLLYACDAKWWRWHDGVPAFTGLKVTLEKPEYPGIKRLAQGAERGFEAAPTRLATGRNSGYQALHLAVHLGARRVLLLGYDMRLVDGRSHWFGAHPVATKPEVYDRMIPCFESLIAPLAARGVAVVNCTPASALACFPMAPLRQALPPHSRV